MFSTFFKARPVIDEANKEWIFDTFAWCIEQLDGDFFNNNSELILPNNTFYPGSSTSVEQMAENIFTNTSKYTGMSSWPIRLVPAETFTPKPMPQLIFESALRGEACEVSCLVSNESNMPSLDIAFHGSQLNQPQDLIAYLVQAQASILVTQNGASNTAIDAPGGNELFAQTIDLVACFMGFGVVFANTAYQFKGGCGSCNNQNLNRQAALPELETVYALALFCVIKGVEIKRVKNELKSHLYKPFRQAYKEITLYLQQPTKPEHALLASNTVTKIR